MTSDFVKRKAAKKRRKADRPTPGVVDADELDGALNKDGADGKAKRDRRKYPKVRRFCKGMCYQDPVLEHEQHDDATTENAAPRTKRRRRGGGAAGDAATTTKLSTDTGLASFTPTNNVRSPKKAGKGAASPEAFNGLPEAIRRYMTAEGYTTATSVQARCWPVLAEGHDAQVLAPTGSGKTLGFLLPLAVRLQKDGLHSSDRPRGPLAVVLAPTREVAQQTAQAARRLKALFKLSTVTLFGGVPKEEQAQLLMSNPHILVASPGRLVDLMEDGSVSLDHVVFVALDEADKLLSSGFTDQLEAIRAAAGVKKAPKKQKSLVLAPKKLKADGATATRPRPQVCLFSATMPEAIESVTKKWLFKPKSIQVTSQSGTSISPNATQVVQVCAEHKKPKKLLKHLEEIYRTNTGRNPPRVLVFANRVKTVRFLHSLLKEATLRVTMLHGERSQAEREEAMLAFRSGKSPVLVATDVAARGLHVHGLPYIVNYDFPSNLESYVHRVGRTGRLAANGHCFSFFTRSLARLAPPLLALLKSCGSSVDPNLVTLAEAWEEALRQDPELANACHVGDGDGDEEEEEEGAVAPQEEDEEERGEEATPDEVLSDDGVVDDPKVRAPKASRPTSASGRRKALPGRLRKKLAKEKAKRG